MTAARILLVCFSVLFLIFGGFSCGDDDDDDEDAGPPWQDSDDDDDNSNNNQDDDDDWTPPTEMKIESTSSPTEYTVTVTFTQDIGDQLALDLDAYTLTWDNGEWGTDKHHIKDIQYDSGTRTATLTTFNRLLLGVEYMIILRMEGFNRTDDTVLAAETSRFWIDNFSTGAQEQITADRVGVTETGVFYLEQGETVNDLEKTLDEWENTIYPGLTTLFVEPSDIDGNGRVTVLGLDGGSSYGGYYDPLNLYSDAQLSQYGIRSNEMELLHINTRGNSFEWHHTLPHEFQHLLYHNAHEDVFLQGISWLYHNEGLSENAVLAVYGNQGAIDNYLADYNGHIAKGYSLVNWKGSYANYALSHLFFAYLAAKGGGVSFIPEIFNLEEGSPENVTELIQFLMGPSEDFASVQMDWMVANWLQESTGVYGYEGLLSFAAESSPTVSTGTESLDLEPYGGSYFKIAQGSVDYPGTQGPNIVYAGIDGQGNVDYTAPFDISNGVLVVLNTNQQHDSFPTEPSGPDIAAVKEAMSVVPSDWIEAPAAWNDPPPVFPWDPAMEQWRESAKLRAANELLYK